MPASAPRQHSPAHGDADKLLREDIREMVDAADEVLQLTTIRKNLHGRGWAAFHELPEWEIFQMTEEYHDKYGEPSLMLPLAFGS